MKSCSGIFKKNNNRNNKSNSIRLQLPFAVNALTKQQNLTQQIPQTIKA